MWKCKAFNDLTTNELFDIYKLRTAVFVVEQNCPYQEVDDDDLESLHLFQYKGQQLIAYCRLIPLQESLKLGRVLVQPDFRGQQIGRALVKQAIQTAYDIFQYQPIHIQAQAHLEHFYASFGFIPTSSVYLEDNIPHLDMILPVER